MGGQEINLIDLKKMAYDSGWGHSRPTHVERWGKTLRVCALDFECFRDQSIPDQKLWLGLSSRQRLRQPADLTPYANPWDRVIADGKELWVTSLAYVYDVATNRFSTEPAGNALDSLFRRMVATVL